MNSKIDLLAIELFLLVQGMYVFSLLLKFFSFFYPALYMYILGLVLIIISLGAMVAAYGISASKRWAIMLYWVCIGLSVVPKLMGAQNIYLFSSAWTLLILNIVVAIYLALKYRGGVIYRQA